MNAQQLAQYPVKSIQTLIDHAHDIAPTPQCVYMLRNRLFKMPDDEQRLCAAALDELLRENRELRAENQALKMAQQHGGLGDK